MMNKYIIIKYSNYSFIAPLRIKIGNIEVTVNCKIDTGCMKTSIPIKKILIGTQSIKELKAFKLKQDAINNNIQYERSYGVSDTASIRKHDDMLISQGKLIECTSLKFKQKADIFEIANFSLGSPIIGVNYDRTGNILIGMDIMKDWDIHIGKDVKTQETIFLACPYNNINEEYLIALEDHFGIGTTVSSAVFRQSDEYKQY